MNQEEIKEEIQGLVSCKDEEIQVSSFDTDNLLPNSISLIIGDAKTGKSLLIKDLLVGITTSNLIKSGMACVDSSQLPFYSKFIDDSSLYKRYSSLLASRCYNDNTFLILDYYFYSKEKYTEIYENSQKKKMVVLVSLKTFTDFTDYKYIFITKLENLEELIKVYDTYIKSKNFNMSLEQFVHLLNYLDKNEVLVINCKAKSLEQLFFSYLP